MNFLNILASILALELHMHDVLGIVATVFFIMHGNVVAGICNATYLLIARFGGQWFVNQARQTASM